MNKAPVSRPLSSHAAIALGLLLALGACVGEGPADSLSGWPSGDSGRPPGSSSGGDGVCHSAGATCTSYADCCSQSCQQGLCGGGACASVGEGCNGASDCCSGQCIS